MNIRIFAGTVAGLAAFAAGGCGILVHEMSQAKKATGPLVTQETKVDEFTQISVSGPYQVEYTVGDFKAVKIEGQQELLDATKVSVEGAGLGGTLKIKLTGSFSVDKPIKVTVSSPHLRQIDVQGACDFRAVGMLKDEVSAIVLGASHLQASGNFTSIQASGASIANVTDVSAKMLGLRADGSSQLTVKGEVGSVDVTATGASVVNPGIKAEKAKIEANGASHVELEVSESLDATASGASEVRYKGNAEARSTKATGASTISHIK